MRERAHDGSTELSHLRNDRFFEAVATGLGTFIKVEVTGEQIEEPEIITPNHVSYLEVVVVGIAIWRNSGRPASFMAKKELMYPPLGWAFSSWGAFTVNRDNADTNELNDFGRIARDNGRCTTIYPEASRHKGEKDPMEVHVPAVRSGALHMARELGMNVRPAGTVLPSLRRGLVHFGEAFDPAAVDKLELAERMQHALDQAAYEANERWGAPTA